MSRLRSSLFPFTDRIDLTSPKDVGRAGNTEKRTKPNTPTEQKGEKVKLSQMNIMKTTLWRCQNKEVVSVTINVFVNRAKTHPNGCSFSSPSPSRPSDGRRSGRDKGQKPSGMEATMRQPSEIMGCHLSREAQKETRQKLCCC